MHSSMAAENLILFLSSTLSMAVAREPTSENQRTESGVDMFRKRRPMTVFSSGLLLALLLFTGAAAQVQEANLPAVEQEKIENLIRAVEHLSEATFIRNGKPYDAITAARFLRAKLRSRESDVHSADDFIEQIASFSSTTGK
ncbi:MAG: DUF5329 family protein, partial [Desulfomonilia bacterium]|nr:DUF5329 family protein [Desulfomonilia bacterium]